MKAYLVMSDPFGEGYGFHSAHQSKEGAQKAKDALVAEETKEGGGFKSDYFVEEVEVQP